MSDHEDNPAVDRHPLYEVAAKHLRCCAAELERERERYLEYVQARSWTRQRLHPTHSASVDRGFSAFGNLHTRLRQWIDFHGLNRAVLPY
jgi:hypothetical protein